MKIEKEVYVIIRKSPSGEKLSASIVDKRTIEKLKEHLTQYKDEIEIIQ